MKDLESSVGFQQKIIANQRRIVKQELEDTATVKEETATIKEETALTEDLEMVEIKTECFEFELPAVEQSWQEPPKAEIIETEIRIDQKDISLASPASAVSEDDFKADFFRDAGSESSDSDLTEEEFLEPEEKIEKKKPETSKTRVCPYCAGVFTSAGITEHVSVNLRQLLCSSYTFFFFRLKDMKMS